jgi:hypothetical protein
MYAIGKGKKWNKHANLVVWTATLKSYGGDIAQDVPYTATIIDLLCFPIWVQITPDPLARPPLQ